MLDELARDWSQLLGPQGVTIPNALTETNPLKVQASTSRPWAINLQILYVYQEEHPQLSDFSLLLLRMCFYKHVPPLPPWKMQKGKQGKTSLQGHHPKTVSHTYPSARTGCWVGTDSSSIAIFFNYRNTIRFFFVSFNALSLLPGYTAWWVIILWENDILKKMMTLCHFKSCTKSCLTDSICPFLLLSDPSSCPAGLKLSPWDPLISFCF